MSIRNMSRRRVTVFGTLGLLAYVSWLAWPYLHAIVIRDAAVTTWINITAAPVAGYTTRPLSPGERTGPDGRIATITDPRADATVLARAQADLARADARVVEIESVIEATQHALELRAAHASEFAATFSRDVEATMAGAARNLTALRQQLDLDRKEAARILALKKAGVMSQSAQDAADALVAEHERQLADTEAALKRSSERRNAAKDGVFLLEDGTDGNTTLQNLSDARVRLVQAQQSLIQLRAERQAAQTVVNAARLGYEKASSIDILTPPGAMVWSLISSPGGPVQPGTPVASWVDCHVMLVDAPVSDVEAALLHVGSRADVAIEGERHVRAGTAILTRGSAGVLADHDLAAVAKGRHPGVGQVLVKLVPTVEDVKNCDIGRAAYVDFPDVGIFDLIRARLRL